MGHTVWAQGHRNPAPAGATQSAPPDGNVTNHAETVPPVSPQRVTPVSRCIRPRNTRQQEETAGSPERRAFKAMVAGSLPADVSGAVSLTKNDNGRGNASDGGPSAVPPSAHAERTFNHTPNAHGDVTQRQSAGFASRKLSVQIASSPPIPKCPSLRVAMAEMPMSGEQSCTLRQVPRSLPGRQGTTRKAKKWPPLRAAGIAFGNGAKARLSVHGCEKKGHSGSASASISVVQTHSP